MICEFDDFGSNHVISDKCQSHDCRDVLEQLKELNSAFKVTLFAIPGEVTPELLKWQQDNEDWAEFAVHGVFHSSNYECEKMSYSEFDDWMEHSSLRRVLNQFAKGFRAPGWMISDDIYQWLLDHGWWVADQGYNDARRPTELPAYVNYDGAFKVYQPKPGPRGKEKPMWRDVNAHHGHVWDVGWNGIYEDFEKVSNLVKQAESFQFVSELF